MSRFTKRRWLLGFVGLIMYMADICTDSALAFKYFQEKHFVHAALTLLFIVAGLLVTQIFSSAWYLDDMSCGLMTVETKATSPGVSKRGLAALHLLGVGIVLRYGTSSENRCVSVMLKLAKYECAVLQNVQTCLTAFQLWGTSQQHAFCSQPTLHVRWVLGWLSWLTGGSQRPPGETDWWMTFIRIWFYFADRYYHLLKRGFRLAWWTAEYPPEETKHHSLFCLAADLSMLRLLEAFLESVPQLLLQLYIILGRQECSLVQSKPRFLSIHDLVFIIYGSSFLCSFGDLVLFR